MELAPLLASVCTICGEEMPSARAHWVLGTGHSQCGCKEYQRAYCVPVTAAPPCSQPTQGCGSCLELQVTWPAWQGLERLSDLLNTTS